MLTVNTLLLYNECFEHLLQHQCKYYVAKICTYVKNDIHLDKPCMMVIILFTVVLYVIFITGLHALVM